MKDFISQRVVQLPSPLPAHPGRQADPHERGGVAGAGGNPAGKAVPAAHPQPGGLLTVVQGIQDLLFCQE